MIMMYRIAEMQDLFVDAVVVDDNHHLIFASLYGRDTAIQQLLAAFTLSVTSGGLDKISLAESSDGFVANPGESFEVLIGETDRLEKFSGRLPRENVFGNLSHTWIFDPACMKVDRVNRKAWFLELSSQPLSGARVGGDEEMRWKIWQTVKLLSAVPLLDEWMELILRCENICVIKTARTIGRVFAMNVALTEDYEAQIASMVSSRQLGLTAPVETYLAKSESGQQFELIGS
jgi:hypothetical protein